MSDTVGSALGPRASVTRHILVVEDDVDVRETLEDILESEGYTVTTAANGQEALERLSGAALPCVVLLDLMMPVMNGREFLAALRRDPVLANLPVVVATAWPIEAEEAPGHQELLAKPYDLRNLLEVVRRHCRATTEDEPPDRHPPHAGG